MVRIQLFGCWTTRPVVSITCGVDTGQWAVVAQGAYAAAPADVALPLPDMDVYPLLGPMGGGTEIILEVSCSAFVLAYCMHPCCLRHLAEHAGFVQCVSSCGRSGYGLITAKSMYVHQHSKQAD